METHLKLQQEHICDKKKEFVQYRSLRGPLANIPKNSNEIEIKIITVFIYNWFFSKLMVKKFEN